MTIPATLAIVTCVVGILVALTAARISSGPGWRELAPFSAIAGLVAIFAACDACFTLPVSTPTLVGAARLEVFVVGLHGATWFVYGAAQERRALQRHERALIAANVAAALLALVPGVFVSNTICTRRVDWLGLVYRDAYATTAGDVCMAFYAATTIGLAARYFVLRRKVPDALAHFIGLAALAIAGVNDALTTARVYDAPYVIDIGFLVLVVTVGARLASRFVQSTRSLERQTARLRALQTELVNRERLAALGETSAIVAHEVKTPVSIMSNALTVLRRHRTSAADTDALIAVVEEEAQRLKRMTDDLLAFARPHTLDVTSTELRPLIEGALDAVHAASCAEHVEVVIDVDEQVAVVECDAQLVREALINLLTNAFQASHGTEPVHVQATHDRERVRIAVTDDGDGIPHELEARLFKPFFTTRPTGTGLGLAVVRRIAEAHGGEAKVERCDRGTTFVIALPRLVRHH